MKYEIKEPIRDHVPNSSGESLLVTISVKIRPVSILPSPTVKANNPE